LNSAKNDACETSKTIHQVLEYEMRKNKNETSKYFAVPNE
jgi:hypothetical protein